jgi:hypothetical protein
MPRDTRGVAIGLFDKLVGLDVFDSAETLERQWSRLVAGAASAVLDAHRAIDLGMAPRPKHRRLRSKAVDRMLSRAVAAVRAATVTPSVGEGSDVRFRGHRLWAIRSLDHPSFTVPQRVIADALRCVTGPLPTPHDLLG